MVKSDKPDYVLVYDGEGGVRMAPAGTRIDVPPEGHISWPSEPEARPALETVTTPRRPAYVLPLAGAACLCLVGLTLGFVARPKLADVGPSRPVPMQPAPQQAAAAQPDAQMQVTVLPPTPAPVAAVAPRAGRLEVLPPDQRQAAARTVVAAIPAAPRILPVRPRPAPSAAAEDPSTAVADASAVEPTDPCRGARSAAEAMVCGDPDLARADRRLDRAYRAAARSGVPVGQLRAEQDDWLAIREDAAQRSPRALAQVYDQRIEELEAMAVDTEPR